MKIALWCDHWGYGFKEVLKEYLQAKNIQYHDFWTHDESSCDYPDYGIPVSQSVAQWRYDAGILICSNGIGMSMLANKHKYIKAALVYSETSAKLTKKHHNSNILCLWGKEFSSEKLLRFVKIWLETKFEWGRHKRRISKVESLDS